MRVSIGTFLRQKLYTVEHSIQNVIIGRFKHLTPRRGIERMKKFRQPKKGISSMLQEQTDHLLSLPPNSLTESCIEIIHANHVGLKHPSLK